MGLTGMDLLTEQEWPVVREYGLVCSMVSGAGGAIGVQSVVNTPPDGYNFVITNVSLLALAPTSNPKLGFDPHRDLVNIAYIAGSPVVLSVANCTR